jgi:hypothetical protein
MVNGTSRMRASVCASSVLPQPVGPISRMFDFASSTSLFFGVVQALVVVVDRDREHALGAALADHVVVQHVADFLRGRHPSGDFTSEDLFSSRMMSMHSSTHSSQMNTVGPAISLRTSCWLLPQKEQ